MRRSFAALLTAAALLVACGDDAAESTAGGDRPADSTATEPTAGAGDTDPGGADPGGDEPEPTFQDVGPPPTSPDKPAVDIPAQLPTELEKKVLIPGAGPVAANGDTVIVDYIGVRSRDGEEFDNSYDRFEPFQVTLGVGGVIEGWAEGLQGVQAGERLQLDIPGDLAYGAQPQDDVIGADEALTFVIDVRSVIQRSDPDDKPTEPGVPTSEGATDVVSVDLVEGDGAELETGQTAVLDFVLFRGDNLIELESNWGADPLQIVMNESGTLDGLIRGMTGMNVGGLRAITIPPELGFGPEGNPSGGLPAGTDIIVVVQLLGAY